MLLCANLKVKQQQCELGQFINMILQGVPRDGKKGKESKTAERQRECVCARGRALQEEEDSISNKIDC